MPVLMTPTYIADPKLRQRMNDAAIAILSVMFDVDQQMESDRQVAGLCDQYDREEADRDIPRWWMEE